MKKYTLTMVAVACLGLIAVNGWADCGSCAADSAKKAPAECAKGKCSLSGSLSQLDLTADQQAKIGEICASAGCDKQPPKDKKARKACAANRKECMAKIGKILTPEQKKQWAKLRKANGGGCKKKAKKDKDD